MGRSPACWRCGACATSSGNRAHNSIAGDYSSTRRNGGDSTNEHNRTANTDNDQGSWPEYDRPKHNRNTSNANESGLNHSGYTADDSDAGHAGKYATRYSTESWAEQRTMRSVDRNNATDGNSGSPEQSGHNSKQPTGLDDSVGFDSDKSGKHSAGEWNAVNNPEPYCSMCAGERNTAAN